VVLEPSVEEVSEVLLRQLSDMRKAVCQFGSVSTSLMPLMQLTAKPLLDLGSGNPVMREVDAMLDDATARLRELVDASMAGPTALAAKLSSYAAVLALDTGAYVEDFRAKVLELRAAEKKERAAGGGGKKAEGDADDGKDKGKDKGAADSGAADAAVQGEGPAEPEVMTAAKMYADEVSRLNAIAVEVQVLAFDQELFSMVRVQTNAAKTAIASKAEEIRDALLAATVDDCRTQNLHIVEKYTEIQSKVLEQPDNERALQALKDFMEASKDTVEDLTQQVEDVHASLATLDPYNMKIPFEDFALAWKNKDWPNVLKDGMEACEERLELSKAAMMDKLAAEKEAFDGVQEELEKAVARFADYEGAQNCPKYMEEVNSLWDELQTAKATAADFNMRDKVFGFPPTEYNLLNKYEADLVPYYKLWNMLADFNENKVGWLTGGFLELKAEEIDAQVNDWWRVSYKMSKVMADTAPGSAEVALAVRAGTDEFRKYLPVIQSLASPALRDRHWSKLSVELNAAMQTETYIDLQPDEEMTLQTLLDMNIQDHMETVQGVSVSAEKEYSLEKALKAMQGDWEALEFEVMPYKNTGTHLVKGVDDIVMLLDDQIVKTQTMRGSPFIKPIEDETKAWEHKLQYAQHALDEWIACQRAWMYLEPIFCSEDIMRQMPTEARRFQSVDALWRKNMGDTVEDPNFMRCCDRDRILEKFKQANQKLDEITKGLNDYLELKRLAFPRFFFLSNDELLEILSQTKDPLAVQPHLGKCFEGVCKVNFRDDLKIDHAISTEGERMKLVTMVDPESRVNKGNVEMWLLELEKFAWDSVMDFTAQCVADYVVTKRTQWLQNWPAQCIISISQVYWTEEVTAILQVGSSGCKGLAEFMKVGNAQLADIVALVRGPLGKLERKTIGALVVMDLHARDTLQMMVDGHTDFEHDFNWMSQLRYYWEEIKKATCSVSTMDNLNTRYGEDHYLQARIVNARLAYGYEYLGNSVRLVVTPLTDRCYRTMMGAVDLNYGGAPEGPAGTGKTETVKDLAKALAIPCVVFNCSDGLDYLAMGKFFKGLASSGAWACFDEFNRINIEVLSVIAQQILEINVARKTMQTDKKRPFMFHFEGSFLKLNPNANCFITMNPGYAGRAELPDNLKALFRPCAMMVPDYAMIGEIRLVSFGYKDAKVNAAKLVQVLQLSSEQLSSQKHYDYGMRAVQSILVAAGNLRQQLGDLPEWSEDKIVLRAVRDVNLPKFLDEDLPLFNGITNDLFPGTVLPSADYQELAAAIEESCMLGTWVANGTAQLAENPDISLEPIDNFTMKVVQLYETVQVRHSLMVVGQTCSGKTSNFHTLAKAMSICKSRGSTTYDAVQIHTMNPKSISSGQLYGNFDENTHEWSDGILAVTYRQLATDPSGERCWMMLDGPVDAVWIENMNTVMDDNKKLCLMSGEIIKMSDKMTIMMETEDLQEASPATVSRNGIVFMEQKKIGWEPLVNSWNTVQLPRWGWAPQALVPHKDYIHDWCHWVLPPAMYFIENFCIRPVPVTRQELVLSYLNNLEWCFDLQHGVASDEQKALEGLMVLAIYWSIGACINGDGRSKFDIFMRGILSGKNEEDPHWKDFMAKNPDYDVELHEGPTFAGLPTEGTVYDYFWDGKKAAWVSWMDMVEKSKIPKGAAFNEILVPTLDSIRSDHIMRELLTHKHHVMATGETGTGKSVGMLKLLTQGMPFNMHEGERTDLYKPIFLSFSAQTSANQTQDVIDAKLGKRRKGVYGPPIGMTGIIFVDDLNMPAKEEYGAQPPIEILRQWMDHSGWYDRKENIYRGLIDILFATAMGPPGGGRNHITQRYIRHFNVVTFVPFSDEMLHVVFGTMMDWFLSSFPGQVKGSGHAVVDATIGLYNAITEALLPTPSKSHYTFNLRDLAKVFQGTMQCLPAHVGTAPDMIRLWSHETLRVFHDRLIDNSDRQWFHNQLAEQIKDKFKVEYSKVKGPHEVLIYGNFMDTKSIVKPYQEIDDREAMQTMMETYLEDYNMMTTKPMQLVLFMNAIEHVSRISRVINQPNGNALLVGVGGSGRKSVTRLAVSMADFKLFQIQISKTYGAVEFHDDLKKVLMQAGAQNEPSVFLFSDTEIVKESFVEDINGILNTGEVPNLFNSEDMMLIMEGVSEAAAEAGVIGGEAELYAFFVRRCRANLHVVLAFSPIGTMFRTRLRMFPSLVNCCAIDWFTAWPEAALRSVASHFLHDVELDDKTRAGVVDVCVIMQSQMGELSDRFLKSLGRFFYITPTSYLELINTFKGLLAAQRQSVMDQKLRYDNGLQKLVETAAQVADMQEELTALQPKLVIASKETNALIETVTKNTVTAEAQKATVEKEAAVVKIQADEANEMQESCEADLAEAIPALEGAVKALKTLSKSDIVEVKAMKKPPGGVKLTMEAVCIMMGVKPQMIKDPEGGTHKIKDFWGPACKELLGDSKFLNNLMDYDKDNIPVETMAVINAKYTVDPMFTPPMVMKSSVAAAGLCKWVHAMSTYDRVAKVVAPKKAALKGALAAKEAAETMLAGKKAELQKVLDALEELNQALAAALQKKEDLQNQVDDCSAKLQRASQLINGLGGERVRWTENSASLQLQYDNIVGDIVLASGFVAYLGAFTSGFREEATVTWSGELRKADIKCADSFSMHDTLGEPVKVRAWTINKLPNDAFSIDNAIMLFCSNRWPLMIDPQGQANRWIKNTERDNSLRVVKQNQSSFVRTIENCITFGQPVLMENAPESLDPVLESVLLKQVITQGGVSTIRLGDNTVEYDAGFRFYMTTKLNNPHYQPETIVKVNLLNFMATTEGLQDQMQGIVVAKEQPALAKKAEELVIEDADNKRQLKEIEDLILKLLKEAEGNILDDEVLINTLSSSKETSNMIELKVAEAEKTNEVIAKTRASYLPVAFVSANLFFCISDLAAVDPMYQYSLEWFISLFIVSISKAEKASDFGGRLDNLNDSFTFMLYTQVCRSLFEKSKLLFSFLLTIKILLGREELNPLELRFFLTGSTNMDLAMPNPVAAGGWLSDRVWGEILALAELKTFAGIDRLFAKDLPLWENVFNSADPATLIRERFGTAEGEEAAASSDKFDDFQRLLLLRSVRPDCVVPEISSFVNTHMGQRYIEPPPFDLMASFVDSTCASPLIFVLSPGADPMSELLKLADAMGMSKKLFAISLGQGQGPLAEKAVQEAVDKGTWVCLQNCHLFVSWMTTLERMCEEMTPELVHADFRLWLTSEPSPAFPVFVLQNGVKMVNEPPKGLRASLTGTILRCTEEFLQQDPGGRGGEFKKMMFGLSFFHATVIERLKFGPVGWNIKYVFSTPDFNITLSQLTMFLDGLRPQDPVPYAALQYLAGECNYGGRVTDDKDRRCIMAILSDFYCEGIQQPEYRFSKSGLYYSPADGKKQDYLDYIATVSEPA
jgi:dynein heavy chain